MNVTQKWQVASEQPLELPSKHHKVLHCLLPTDWHKECLHINSAQFNRYKVRIFDVQEKDLYGAQEKKQPELGEKIIWDLPLVKI